VLRLILVALALAAELPAQDLQSFWQTTREQLARESLDAQVAAVAEPLPYRKFKVTLRSLGGIRFHAFLALPIQGEAPAKPWPVLVTTPGYGGRQQGLQLGEAQRGYAILQIFPRGQGDSTALWEIDGPDKLTWRLDQPGGAYYQGAYADVMRGLDFVQSHPELGRERIALVGTSQGGGIGLAVAALDPRVRAVVAHVPFLCNIRLAARTPGSLVQQLLVQAGRNDEAALRTLDFFDPLHLAADLKAPVLVSAGGRDDTCPAATIQSVVDRLPGRKTLMFYPDLTHTSSVDFYNLTWAWLETNFRQR
jgi:cephalosporin-C deacetylase